MDLRARPADPRPPVVAVLGKGGVGKTAVCALLARTLIDLGRKPLLLVDADPAGGLSMATDTESKGSLAGVSQLLTQRAQAGPDEAPAIASELDYHLLAALSEGPDFSLLAMGAPEVPGCFCPVNSLLRLAMAKLASPFEMVIVDAEAGLEQVQRQVFEKLQLALLVSDGSLRGAKTTERLANMVGSILGPVPMGLILNRCPAQSASMPARLELWAELPLDPHLAERDRRGESLLEMAEDDPALRAMKDFVCRPGSPLAAYI